jgi:hypothetical protein
MTDISGDISAGLGIAEDGGLGFGSVLISGTVADAVALAAQGIITSLLAAPAVAYATALSANLIGFATDPCDDFELDVDLPGPINRGWDFGSNFGNTGGGPPHWELAGNSLGAGSLSARHLFLEDRMFGDVFGVGVDNSAYAFKTFVGLVPNAQYQIEFNWFNYSYCLALCMQPQCKDDPFCVLPPGATSCNMCLSVCPAPSQNSAAAFVFADGLHGTPTYWEQLCWPLFEPGHPFDPADLILTTISQQASATGTMLVSAGLVRVNGYMQVTYGLDYVCFRRGGPYAFIL